MDAEVYVIFILSDFGLTGNYGNTMQTQYAWKKGDSCVRNVMLVKKESEVVQFIGKLFMCS